MSSKVENIKFGKPAGFFDVFERRPGNIKKKYALLPRMRSRYSA